MLHLLLESGADPLLRNAKKESALDLAMFSKEFYSDDRAEIVAALLDHVLFFLKNLNGYLWHDFFFGGVLKGQFAFKFGENVWI